MWRAVSAFLPRAKVPAGRTRCLPPPQPGRSLLRGTLRHRWPGAAAGTRPPKTLGMTPGIQRVEALDAGRLVRVEWEDGSESRYPCVWLRDNCQCPRCFLRSARARRLLFEDLDVDIAAKDVALPDRKKVFGASFCSPCGSGLCFSRGLFTCKLCRASAKLLRGAANWGTGVFPPLWETSFYRCYADSAESQAPDLRI